jgi:chromosome segregation ATPase
MTTDAQLESLLKKRTAKLKKVSKIKSELKEMMADVREANQCFYASESLERMLDHIDRKLEELG